jgi:hypothetical protein
VRLRISALVVSATFLAALAAGCSGDESEESQAATSKAPPVCPAKWRAGWQRLANRVDVAVYCPTWMPSPLDAEIGGQWNSDGPSVSKDRSYLVGFLWHEAGSGDVHVNFRAYPGSTKIPRCIDTQTSGGKTRRRSIPCFSDPRDTRIVRGRKVTVYTVNRDADQWHVLYAWKRKGTLYTVSEHVAPPLTFSRVVRNLDRLVETAALVEPTPSA